MAPIDERAQQVMDEERKFLLLGALDIIAERGETDPALKNVAELLARELGLLDEWRAI